MKTELQKKINISIDLLLSVNKVDLADICNITEQAIKAGGGFGWLKVPPRDTLKKYWKGVLLVKNRKLIVGRLNNGIAGTLQLIFNPPNNEAQQHICSITSHFVAPWARGHGLAKAMIDKAEETSKENGSSCVQLDVRETQKAAIQLIKSKGYKQWGTNPDYANVDGNNIKGFYFLKKLK